MLTVRQAARYAFVLFLPSAFALACVILFVEGLARRGSLIGVGTGLNLPLFIGGPVTMAFGYAVMLLITERLVHRDGFNEQWPHVLSAIGCIVLLGVVSIFTQGAGLPFILGAYVVAGAITAVIPVSRGLWVARER